MDRKARNWLMLAFAVLFMGVLVAATTVITDESITVGNTELASDNLLFDVGEIR